MKHIRHSGRLRCSAIVIASLLAAVTTSAEEKSGKALYEAQCADCHGAKGEGVADAFPTPLVGDRSLVELTKLIAKTMPEGAPEDCVGAEAEAVAEYVYDTFYSRVAQARNRPARVLFSRLTVRQYENAIADLLGSFGGAAHPGDERGLLAEYYDDRRFNGKKRAAERTDPVVDFDFGEGVPIPEKTKPEAFAIRWRGSVIAPSTGEYEFVLRTENGARLTVNGERVVDVWVRSGNDTEHRGSIRLLAGRAYPLDLEFFTFKEKTASIRLEWKRPHHVTELVPERALSPKSVPATFVVTTPFPPDDASEGYERGTSVSKAWYEATTRAALEVAPKVVDLSRAAADTDDRDERVRRFCRTFVDRAFRRPLSDEEAATFVDAVLRESDDLVVGVERFAVRVLTSPRFLYRAETGERFDDFDTAAWLSFGLWDSIPDDRLLAAAASGELQSEQKLRQHADRMARDPRAKAKLAAFLLHWLRVDHFPEIDKNDDRFPGFDEQLVSDLRTSIEVGLNEWLREDSASLRDLLLENTVYANDRIATFYGWDGPSGSGFEPVEPQPPRAGLPSHPYLMAGYAYDSATSPIHRGVFVSRSLLGRRLRPPPIAVAPLVPDLHPDLTTRERVELQTSPANCRSCHDMINPLGFPFEQFDAVGRFREDEGAKPVVTKGHYLDRSGERSEFDDAGALVTYLAESDEVHEAFVEQLFQFTINQPVQAWGPDQLGTLTRSFTNVNLDVRKLLVDIAVTSAVGRRVESKLPADATAAAKSDSR